MSLVATSKFTPVHMTSSADCTLKYLSLQHYCSYKFKCLSHHSPVSIASRAGDGYSNIFPLRNKATLFWTIFLQNNNGCKVKRPSKGRITLSSRSKFHSICGKYDCQKVWTSKVQMTKMFVYKTSGGDNNIMLLIHFNFLKHNQVTMGQIIKTEP